MTGREYILDVHPRTPEKLARLEELAQNLWYSWHRPTRMLFATTTTDEADIATAATSGVT